VGCSCDRLDNTLVAAGIGGNDKCLAGLETEHFPDEDAGGFMELIFEEF
jgi:hypothetical protein